MKKEVGIVFRMDSPGGVQSCVLALIKGLNRQGIIPDIIWDIEPDWNMLGQLNIIAEYAPIKFRFSSKTIDQLPYTLRYVVWIFNLLTENELPKNYNFIYSFYNGLLLNTTPSYIFFIWAPFLPQFNNVPKDIQHLPRLFFQWLYKNYLFRSFPVYEFHKHSRYFINANYTARLFEEAHGVRLPVLYPPINLSDRNYVHDDMSNRSLITYFSRIVDYKRPEMVLELAKIYHQFQIVIMGAVSSNRMDYFQRLKEKGISMGLTNVSFITNPTDAKIREILAKTRFYIFPAVNEHFGMTTPEAIASGVIPFVHNSGGQKEIVQDSRLRFIDSEYLSKFSTLVNLPTSELNQIRQELYEHIKLFSEEYFIEQMISCM